MLEIRISISEFLSRSLHASVYGCSYAALLIPLARTADGEWLQNQMITNWESFEDLTDKQILMLSPSFSSKDSRAHVEAGQARQFWVNEGLTLLGQDNMLDAWDDSFDGNFRQLREDRKDARRYSYDYQEPLSRKEIIAQISAREKIEWIELDKANPLEYLQMYPGWEHTPTINKTRKIIENAKSSITLATAETSLFFGIPEGWLPCVVILSLREKRIVVLSTDPPFSLYKFVKSLLIRYAPIRRALMEVPQSLRAWESRHEYLRRLIEKEKSFDDGWQRQRNSLRDLLQTIANESTTNAKMANLLIEWLYNEDDTSTDIKSKCSEFLEHIKTQSPSDILEQIQRRLPRFIEKRLKMQYIRKHTEVGRENFESMKRRENFENGLSAAKNNINDLNGKWHDILHDPANKFASLLISTGQEMGFDNAEVNLKSAGLISDWNVTLLAQRQDIYRKIAELKALNGDLDTQGNRYEKEEERIIRPKRLKKARVFLSYSHEDGILMETLIAHIKGLDREGLTSVWYQDKIKPGSNTNNEITARLTSSDLILLLVSPHFIASDDCYREMQQAIALHNSGKTLAIPVLLSPTLWEETPLGVLTPLPANRTPVTLWKYRSEAFYQIMVNMRRIIYLLPIRERSAEEVEWDS